MEYNIYDLMNGLQDDSVPLPEDDAAGLRRIKELTMNKIQDNQGTRGVRPLRRMTRVVLVAAVAAVLCIATVAAAKLGVADAFKGFFGQLSESQRQVMETLGTTDLPAPVTSHGTTLTPVAAICDKHNYYLRLHIEAPSGTVLHIPDPSEGWLQLSARDEHTLDPNVLQVDGCDEMPFYSWHAVWYDDTPGDNVLETVVWFSSRDQGQRNPDPYRPADPVWVDFTDDTPKSVNIHNISIQDNDHEYTVLLEGDWRFDLPPAQEHPTLHIDTSGLTLESTDPGRMVYPDYFNISALSLEFEYRYDPLYVDAEYPDGVEREEKFCEIPGGWAVVLKDGTTVPLGTNYGDGYHDFAYLIQPFTAPIDITQVDHICFGGLTIPVNQ